MNTPIRRLSVVIAALFAALLVASTMVQFVQAKTLDAMTANKRTLLDNYSRERGAIVVADQNIAESVQVDDQYEWLRTYPQGKLYSQITGFYSYAVGNPYGLEHASDDLLSGGSDSLFVRRVTDLLTGRQTAGATLDLTIDPKAQAAADQALGNSRGAVVALDPQTGAILAMVSHPQYDPNPISSHDLKKAASAWNTLRTDPNKAFLNRSINQLYPPGSTFKVVTAAAALENGIVTDENSVVPGPGHPRPAAHRHEPAQRDRPALRPERPDHADPRHGDLVQHGVRLTGPRARRREAASPGREVRLRRQPADPATGDTQLGAGRPQRAAGGPVGHRPVRRAHHPPADGDGGGRDRQRRQGDDALPDQVGAHRRSRRHRNRQAD